MKTMTKPMTLDEFMQRYSDEGPFEIIEGSVQVPSPAWRERG